MKYLIRYFLEDLLGGILAFAIPTAVVYLAAGFGW